MTIERDDPQSAHYCERRAKYSGNTEHLFTERQIITNKRNKVKIVMIRCSYCGRIGKREEVPFP